MTSPTPPPNRRWRLVADLRIQGESLIRLAVYWAIFQFAQLSTIALFSFLQGGNAPQSGMQFLIPSVIVSFLFLPVVMLDNLRYSNRFVGPIINLKKNLKKLSEGKPGEPVHFRKGDYWQDLADSYNTVRQQCLDRAPVEQPETGDRIELCTEEQCHV